MEAVFKLVNGKIGQKIVNNEYPAKETMKNQQGSTTLG
jgi:hypothetical protein